MRENKAFPAKVRSGFALDNAVKTKGWSASYLIEAGAEISPAD